MNKGKCTHDKENMAYTKLNAKEMNRVRKMFLAAAKKLNAQTTFA